MLQRMLLRALARGEKTEEERLFGSKTRQRMLRIIAREPGVILGQILAELGISSSGLYHHLDMLQGAGLVRIVQDGRLRRVYLVANPTTAALAPQIRGAVRRRVADAILRAGETTVAQLRDAEGLSRRVAYHHTRLLVESGLVERVPNAQGPDLLRATPKLEEALRGRGEKPE